MKFSTLLVLGSSLILLSGCTWMQQTAEVATPEEQTQPTENEQRTWSLQEAMTSGQAMRCTYNDGQGEVTSLVKGDRVRVEGVHMGTNKGTGWMINDGTWMYTWADGEKKGTKFNVADMKAMAEDLKNTPGMGDLQNPEQWANDVATKYQVECQPATASDDDFVPPADIEFQDMGAMMKNTGDMTKKMMQNITPGDLEQMKKLIPSGFENNN